jgi:hypothetical protein
MFLSENMEQTKYIDDNSIVFFKLSLGKNAFKDKQCNEVV